MYLSLHDSAQCRPFRFGRILNSSCARGGSSSDWLSSLDNRGLYFQAFPIRKWSVGSESFFGLLFSLSCWNCWAYPLQFFALGWGKRTGCSDSGHRLGSSSCVQCFDVVAGGHRRGIRITRLGCYVLHMGSLSLGERTCVDKRIGMVCFLLCPWDE